MPTCQYCHHEFSAYRPEAKYCSGACRVAAHRRAKKPTPRGHNLGPPLDESAQAFRDRIVKELSKNSPERLATLFREANEFAEGGRDHQVRGHRKFRAAAKKYIAALEARAAALQEAWDEAEEEIAGLKGGE